MPYLWGLETENRTSMKKKRFPLLLVAALCAATRVSCQESASVFNFLNLPYSAHVTGLGGHNISVIEDDITLVTQNPSLLSSVSSKTVGFNFLTYMKGSKAGSVAYAQAVGERGTWGVSSQFVGYGSMNETLPSGEVIGKMHAQDICVSGTYAYLLSDNWSGGATGKAIYSHYGDFTSCALAVDLGVNYFLPDQEFSLSAAARNIGGQVKAFGDHHERLPFDLEVGFTKELGHAPISISVTLIDLTRWNKKYFYSTADKISGGRVLTNHFNLGVDVKPAKFLYVSAAYNFRRAYEMKAAGSSHAAGLSFGAGVQLKKFCAGLGYAKYHVGAPTLSFNIAYNFLKD